MYDGPATAPYYLSRLPTHTPPTGLTSCQTRALDVLQREGNVFLTGAAGTGKSFLLEQYLRGKGSDDFPIVASTGAAAVLVGGRTFHSFFGIGILEGGVEASVQRALQSRKVVRRLQRACCVIIDEVSMLSGETLRAAEAVARHARQRPEAWGGLRLITVGDFAQLPPVTPGLQQKDWGFRHPVWQLSDFQPALLSTVMRTQDADFLDVLNAVRIGQVTDQVRDFLDEHTHSAHHEDDATRLYPHRATAEQYNLMRLEALPSTAVSIATRYSGEDRFRDTFKRNLPIGDTLTLKRGALVMLRRNDPTGEGQYVNGSLGHVRSIDDDRLEVRLLSGLDIEVEPVQFSALDGDGNVVMTAQNFPLSLAWATTIHKAQGASLDRLIVDLRNLWEPGQAYVALSRVRSGQGLVVEAWNEAGIRADADVTHFYDQLAVQAERYVPRPFFLPERPTSEEADDHEEDTPRFRRTKKGGPSAKDKRLARTRELVRQETPLVEMLLELKVTLDTLARYLGDITNSEKPVDLRYLLRDIDDLPRICTALETHGTVTLKPAYDALGGDIDYDTLKLVRVVLAAVERG